MQLKEKFFVTFCLVLFWITASAQTFPVQVSTSVIPPYSLYLSDYTTSDKLAVNLLFNDPVRVELSVRLKLTIEGRGISISTKPEFNPRPIYLQSGFPERLSGADLAPYFDPRNLNFQGVDRNQFERKGALPEGVYRICIEVYEHAQNRKVSNVGCSVAWLVMNDPPIINYPQNGEKIKIQDPQLVIFNWTPRHTGSPNSAFATEYELELVEVRSHDRNPNNAILSMPPIFKTTTQSTSIYYGLAETPLIPGQQYAFRVRAKALSGIEETDLFKNQGYSEVFTFTYGDYCLSPGDIGLEPVGPTNIKANWVTLPAHTSFTVRYREKKDKAEWFERDTYLDGLNIGSLRPETEYEVQVIGRCGVIRNEDIRTYTVKTTGVSESEFVCGGADEQVVPGSSNLISSLSPGSFIESGNFKVALVEITPSAGGTFSGRGVAYIPWFKLAGLKVEFKDIKVNEERKVIAGNIVSTQSENSRWTWNVENKVPNPAPDNNTVSDNSSDRNNTGDSTNTNNGENPDRVIVANNPTITTDEEGNTIIKDDDGNVTEVKEGERVTVKDSEGNETIVVGGRSGRDNNDDASANNGGGGNGSGGGSGSSSTQNKWSLADGQFGPIKVTFTDEPVQKGQEVNGVCSYEAKGSFDVALASADLSKEVHFENVDILFTKNCESGDLIGAGFRWKDLTGVENGKIGIMSVSTTSMELFLAKDGKSHGIVGLNAYLNQDVNFSQLPGYDKLDTDLDLLVKSGLRGDFSFKLDIDQSKDKIAGSWDFLGIKNINVDLVKEEDLLAQLVDGALQSDGILKGTVTSSYPLSYKSDHCSILLNDVSLDLELALYKGLKGWKVTGGRSKATVSDLRSIDGSLIFDLAYTEDGFTASTSSDKLSSFGMTLNDVELTANFNPYLSFRSIKGSFKAKHPKFNTLVNVKRFEFDQEGLQVFNIDGQFTYNSHTVKLQQTTYDKENNLLKGSAAVVSGSGADKSVLSLDKFNIHANGDVEMGEVSGSFDSGEMFGPLRITMDIPKSDEVDSEGYKTYKDIKGSLFLDMGEGNNSVEELAILEASVSFKKNPETSAYKEVRVVWEGDIDVGSIGIVSGKVRKIDLSVNDKGELSGAVTLDAYLNEDLSLTSLIEGDIRSVGKELAKDFLKIDLDMDIVIKEGLNGNFTYNFTRKKDFSGYWDLNGISNINGDLVKADKVIGKFEDGSFDGNNVLSGTVRAYTSATYKNKYASVTVHELNLGFAVSLKEGIKSFKATSGGGVIEVFDIKNVKGSLVLNLECKSDTDFRAALSQSEKSKISAFDMELSNLSLATVFNNNFDLLEISGSAIAKHATLGSIGINNFVIREGKLAQFNGNGNVVYKGFAFDLQKFEYNRELSELSADAKVVLKLGENVQKLEVERFLIDSIGKVSIGRIKGDFNKNNLLALTFDAAFAEDRFSGQFTGKLGLIGLSGDIDLGRAVHTDNEAFNFGYIKIRKDIGLQGIPLGATGLKLTAIGGELGLNYKLKDRDDAVTTTAGNPLKGNYVVGLSLGLADIANICEISGNPVAQFGAYGLQYDLKGSLLIPRSTNPFIRGKLDVTYKTPEESLDGTVEAQIRIPATSGIIFKADPILAFRFEKNAWSIKGNNPGSIFNTIEFKGEIDFSKNGDMPMTGLLDGNISYSKSISYEKGFKLFAYKVDVSSKLDVSFNNYVQIGLTENGISSNFSVDLYGNGVFEVSGSTSYRLEVSGNSSMSVSYQNNEGKIKGDLTLKVQSGDSEGDTYETKIDLTL